MKKLTLIFCLFLAIDGFSQTYEYVYTRSFAKDSTGKTVETSFDSSLAFFDPDWSGLTNALFNSPLFEFAADSARNKNYWATLQAFLVSDGKKDPQKLIGLIIKSDIPFLPAQKTILNSILKQFHFAIQL